MQTVPPYSNYLGQSYGAPYQPSYYPGQSQINPQSYGSQQYLPHPGFSGHYQTFPQQQINQYPQGQRHSHVGSKQFLSTVPTNNPVFQDPNYAQYNGQYDPYYDPRYDPRNQQRQPEPNLKKGQNQRNITQVKQIVYQQQPINIPEPVRNIQYIPQLNRYMDYVEERVKIPVEKYYTDYYEVQHITDFVPREYQDTVIEMVPEQIIRYRLQYVPVQRKIVHLPKNQVYDQNGLFKGVGKLADRVHIDQAAIGLVNQGQRKAQNLTNSQMRGLDESLVNAIGKQIENQPRSSSNLMNDLQSGLRTDINRPQQGITEAIYKNLGGGTQNAQQNLNQALYKNLSGMAGSQQRPLPQNQLINQQIQYQMMRKLTSPKTRQSRRRTNYVTSDSYFPNYEQELRNLDASFKDSQDMYFNQNYAANTANRMRGLSRNSYENY